MVYGGIIAFLPIKMCRLYYLRHNILKLPNFLPMFSSDKLLNTTFQSILIPMKKVVLMVSELNIKPMPNIFFFGVLIEMTMCNKNEITSTNKTKSVSRQVFKFYSQIAVKDLYPLPSLLHIQDVQGMKNHKTRHLLFAAYQVDEHKVTWFCTEYCRGYIRYILCEALHVCFSYKTIDILYMNLIFSVQESRTLCL